MYSYIVTRHGSNQANQELCEEQILGILQAKSRKVADEEKEKWASELGYTVYPNQFLRVTAISKFTAEDQEYAWEIDLGNYIVRAEDISCVRCGRSGETPLPQRKAKWWFCDDCAYPRDI